MGFTCVVLFALASSITSSWSLPPDLDLPLLQVKEEECRRDFDIFKNDLQAGALWAQTMLDASVRSPVGLLSQTQVQYGDFDECLTLVDPVAGQFCVVDVTPAIKNSSSWLPIKWGICVPASCSSQDLKSSLQQYMDGKAAEGDTVSVDIIPELCTTRETASRDITVTDIVYSLVVAFFILLVVIATVHEMRCCEYDRISPPLRISQCLSARHGWYSLLRGDQQIPGVNLSALYGLHATAFFFVVLGHRFGVHIYFMSLTNYRSIEKMFTDSWFSIWSGHMDLFVDVFFFLSAFLLSVFYYAELHKRFVSPVMVYMYRICRIVPAYAVVVFFYVTWLRQLGDGPFWNWFMDVEQNSCKNNWWTNLLFINNYVEKNNMCVLQSWYITCDFQLFLAGTLLVFLLQKKAKTGLIVTVIVFILSTIAPFLGTYLYDRPALVIFYKDFWHNPRQHDLFMSVYSQAHYRGTSYILGLLAGCYVYSQRQSEPLSRSRVYALQAAGCLVCLCVYWSGSIFYDTTTAPHPLITALYAASFHSLFNVGLVLLVVSFTLGKSTVVSKIFSWKGFVPLSKLSYCVYLIHNIPQFVWIASSRTTVYINPLELVSWSIADVAISLVAALVLCLTVETPVRYLIKYLVTGSPPSPLPQVTMPQEKYSIQEELYNFDKR